MPLINFVCNGKRPVESLWLLGHRTGEKKTLSEDTRTIAVTLIEWSFRLKWHWQWQSGTGCRGQLTCKGNGLAMSSADGGNPGDAALMSELLLWLALPGAKMTINDPNCAPSIN